MHVPFGKLSFEEGVRRSGPAPPPAAAAARCPLPTAERAPLPPFAFARLLPPQDLVTNLKAVQETVDKNKPTGAKGRFWTSMYICSSMGPSLKIDVDALTKMVAV